MEIRKLHSFLSWGFWVLALATEATVILGYATVIEAIGLYAFLAVNLLAIIALSVLRIERNEDP